MTNRSSALQRYKKTRPLSLLLYVKDIKISFQGHKRQFLLKSYFTEVGLIVKQNNIIYQFWGWAVGVELSFMNWNSSKRDQRLIWLRRTGSRTRHISVRLIEAASSRSRSRNEPSVAEQDWSRPVLASIHQWGRDETHYLLLVSFL
jgi:hypothetical protein